MADPKSTSTKTRARRRQAPSAETILEAALDLAEQVGWSDLQLRDVAERLGISLSDVLGHYRDKDAVADAWFETAWQAMLAAPPKDFDVRPAKERIEFLLLRWFDALAPRREVTGQMLNEKLYPSHPHHWVPMIFNLSRTIQWLRDAAGLNAMGQRKQLEEVGLTLLFLATLRVWVRDQSESQERTRAFLQRRLERADRAMATLYRRAIEDS